jgi:ABC-type glycerol-3-phosphate transport system permease component
MRIGRLYLGRYAAITLIGVVIAFPLYYLLSGSLMTYNEIVSYPPKFFASDPQWSNYATAFSFLTPRTIGNTFIFVIGVLVLQLAICLPAGFALAKIKFRGAGFLLVFFVLPIFVPTNLILIPTYIVTFKLGLIGSFLGMILPIAGQASVGVLLFRQFFAGLPDGLMDAARLDGAGWFQTFFRVALPLARPIIAAYSVVTFLTAWNMYIWPLLTGPGPDTRVLTVAVAPLAQTMYSNVSPSIGFAAAVISIVPVLVVFIAFQKWFTKGVVGTGLE